MVETPRRLAGRLDDDKSSAGMRDKGAVDT